MFQPPQIAVGPLPTHLDCHPLCRPPHGPGAVNTLQSRLSRPPRVGPFKDLSRGGHVMGPQSTPNADLAATAHEGLFPLVWAIVISLRALAPIRGLPSLRQAI